MAEREVRIRVIRSARQTSEIKVGRDGSVTVRAPYLMTDRDVRELLDKHRRWILQKLDQVSQEKTAAAGVQPFTREELEALGQQALRVIPERVRHYAELIGVDYGRITIRCQRTRWGSCTKGGNLNFNCLLMLAPPEVLDSVVVHELCHRKEMNHSERFYREVYRVFPEYDTCHNWLREHEGELYARLPQAT